MYERSQIRLSLESYVSSKGKVRAIRMFEFALPYIIEKDRQLSQALLENDLDNAAFHAHKAISSVHLYGNPNLEKLLCQIRDGIDSKAAPEMQRLVSAEFAAVRAEIEDWLSETSA